MGKQLDRKKSRNSRQYVDRQHGDAEIIEFKGNEIPERSCPSTDKGPQSDPGPYLAALRSSPQVIVLGPAGTGKTWIAATYAADLFAPGRIDKIILTRPNVPCGRSLGFFPARWKTSSRPGRRRSSKRSRSASATAPIEIALKRGDIEMVPFEVMRGRSWKNAFVLLDEAQNATPAEIKTFLTRIGEDCIVVDQRRRQPVRSRSGLRPAARCSHLDQVADAAGAGDRIQLDDIVRSGICAMWVRAFEGEGASHCDRAGARLLAGRRLPRPASEFSRCAGQHPSGQATVAAVEDRIRNLADRVGLAAVQDVRLELIDDSLMLLTAKSSRCKVSARFRPSLCSASAS